MAGLLDFYSDPKMMALLGLSSGLVQAGAPSPYPRGIAEAGSMGLLQGAQAAQGAAQQNLARTYLGEQVKALQATNARTDAMAPILRQLASRLQPQGAAGGGSQNPMLPGQPGSSVMAGGPVGMPQQQPAQQGPGGGLPFSLEDITMLKLIGGPDLTSAYNAAKPPDAVRNLQAAGVAPTSPEGRAMLAGPAYAELLKMQNQPAEVLIPGTQIKVPTTQAIANAFNTGVAPDDQTAMQAMQIASKHGVPMEIGVGHLPALSRSGESSPAAPRHLAADEAARLKQGATTVGEGDARRVLELEAKIPSMLSVVRRLDRMERLSADDTTYAAAGAEIKTTLGSIAQGFGLPVKKEKTANAEEYLAHVAELLKDRLASKDYGSGSGVSNLDIIAARAPLPELAKTAQGRSQIIQALRADTERNLTDAQAARDFFDSNSGLRGFRFPSEVAAERDKRTRELPKAPGTPPSGGALPAGVTVRRIR